MNITERDVKTLGRVVSITEENVVADAEQVHDSLLNENQLDVNLRTRFVKVLPRSGGLKTVINSDLYVGTDGFAPVIHTDGNFEFMYNSTGESYLRTRISGSPDFFEVRGIYAGNNANETYMHTTIKPDEVFIGRYEPEDHLAFGILLDGLTGHINCSDIDCGIITASSINNSALPIANSTELGAVVTFNEKDTLTGFGRVYTTEYINKLELSINSSLNTGANIGNIQELLTALLNTLTQYGHDLEDVDDRINNNNGAIGVLKSKVDLHIGTYDLDKQLVTSKINELYGYMNMIDGVINGPLSYRRVKDGFEYVFLFDTSGLHADILTDENSKGPSINMTSNGIDIVEKLTNYGLHILNDGSVSVNGDNFGLNSSGMHVNDQFGASLDVGNGAVNLLYIGHEEETVLNIDEERFKLSKSGFGISSDGQNVILGDVEPEGTPVVTISNKSVLASIKSHVNGNTSNFKISDNNGILLSTNTPGGIPDRGILLTGGSTIIKSTNTSVLVGNNIVQIGRQVSPEITAEEAPVLRTDETGKLELRDFELLDGTKNGIISRLIARIEALEAKVN